MDNPDAACFTARTMTNGGKLWIWALAVTLLAAAATSPGQETASTDLWPTLLKAGNAPPLQIEHPINGAVLPANFPPPVLLWKTNSAAHGQVVAGFVAGDRKWLFSGLEPRWRRAGS